MDKLEALANPEENIKMRSSFRDAIYHRLREQDTSGVFGNPGDIFPIAFALGYHFNQQHKVGANAINHVNVVSLDPDFKRLAVLLVVKRKPELLDAKPKEVWKEIEMYAEYGIQVLFKSWKEHGSLDITAILKKPVFESV